ncbi:MAG: 6-phosphogluconolactonase, partial [Anaerolineae bacterium]|nr:6-phosphogluconolactonase [Anaerolineae bacterium]
MCSHRDSPTLHIFATAAELSKKVCAYIAQLSADTIEQKGSFTIALSGGSMPKLLAPIAAPPLRDQIKWTAWSVFWSDERCVPLEHPDSNYRSADQFIFSQVNIPEERIYTLDDSLAPAEAADAYQALLGQIFQPLPGQWPEFDLILLGMG